MRLNTFRTVNVIVMLTVLLGCDIVFNTFLSPRGTKICPPFTQLESGIFISEIELERKWSGWDTWIGDKERDMNLFEKKIQCSIRNTSTVPLRLIWFPSNRKWLKPGEQIEWYNGAFRDVVLGQGINRRHCNIFAADDTEIIKFSLKLVFENTGDLRDHVIPVIATFSDNI